MLATSGALPTDEERWAFEPKWDGFRAIAQSDGHRVRIMSRRGTDLAGRLLELAPLAGSLPAGTTLDGELVVVDAAGRVDFDGMRRRGFGQAATGRLFFVAFDVLALAGHVVMARRWDARRAMLVDLALDGSAWCTTPAYPGEGTTLFEATRAAGVEGVVAKRLDAPYRPGVRTKTWVKTKHFDRAWFDVLGVAPTPEERYVLLLGSRTGGQVRYVGRVEWGWPTLGCRLHDKGGLAGGIRASQSQRPGRGLVRGRPIRGHRPETGGGAGPLPRSCLLPGMVRAGACGRRCVSPHGGELRPSWDRRREGICCRFHGWTWDGDGRHVRMTWQGRAMAMFNLRSYPVWEADGRVWIRLAPES